MLSSGTNRVAISPHAAHVRDMHMTHEPIAAVFALMFALVPASAGGQAELQGRVLSDSGRRPLVNAEVALPRLGLRTLSDSLGRYRLLGIPAGEYLIVTRAVGFRADSTTMVFEKDETLAADVALKPPLTSLEAVNVREEMAMVPRGMMAGYDERKARGIGHFFEGDVFTDGERRLSDVLSGKVPGMAIKRGTGSRAWASSGRATTNAKCGLCRVDRADIVDNYDAATGAPLACYMDTYVDGAMVYSSASSRQMPLFNLNSIDPRNVKAIEVYTSTSQIPPQFVRMGAGCGVMVIWTRASR